MSPAGPSAGAGLAPAVPRSGSTGPAPARLRPFAPADIPEALALWRATEGIGLNESDEPPALAAFLDRNPGLSRVAEDSNGRLLGTVLCGHDGRRGYLHHLAVRPAARRHGLGRALVRDCLTALRARGIPKCNLFLYADNAAGRIFWERLGFAGRPDLLLLQRPTSPTD